MGMRGLSWGASWGDVGCFDAGPHVTGIGGGGVVAAVAEELVDDGIAGGEDVVDSQAWRSRVLDRCDDGAPVGCD